MNSILKLIARIENSNSEDVSLKDVRVLAKSQDPEAIDALAGLLDDEGRVGREAARALTRFGRLAEPTLRRCLGSHNETVVANARELLAALGENTTPELTEAEAAAVIHGAPDEAEAPDDAATEVEVPPPVLARNDNATAEPVDFAILADPEIVRSIGARLFRRGVALQDIDDGVAEVQTRVLELLRVAPGPNGLAEWKALANRVATDFAIDRLRQADARGKHEADLCEDPDAYAEETSSFWDPVDASRMISVFVGMHYAGQFPPLTAQILKAKIEGDTDAEASAWLGLTVSTIEKRRRVIRGRFVWKLNELGMGHLVPGAHRQKSDGEAAVADDLPASLPHRR